MFIVLYIFSYVSRETLVKCNKTVEKPLEIGYYIDGAISIDGTRSGSEDSSLNVLYLCAPFFVGDYNE